MSAHESGKLFCPAKTFPDHKRIDAQNSSLIHNVYKLNSNDLCI
jgi:hypothetical protein